jgi:putative ribosome biogenesis GTPase RsgA
MAWAGGRYFLYISPLAGNLAPEKCSHGLRLPSANRAISRCSRCFVADVAVITKIDLAAAVEFNVAAANRSIQAVRFGMTVLDVSAKSRGGMEEFLQFLRSHRAATHAVAAPG